MAGLWLLVAAVGVAAALVGPVAVSAAESIGGLRSQLKVPTHCLAAVPAVPVLEPVPVPVSAVAAAVIEGGCRHQHSSLEAPTHCCLAAL